MKILTLIGLILLSVPAMKAEDSLYFKVEAGPAFQNVHVHIPSASFNLKAKTGIRADLIGGYDFNDYLAGELNVAMIHTDLIDGGHTSFYQVPLMANVLGKYPMGKWQPYAGAGLGCVMTMPDNHGQGQDDADEVFGTQAMAGIQYHITSSCSLELGYKFLYTATSHPAFGIDLGPVYTHSLLAGLSWHF
jgi:opacity protein-like surface antigen